MFNTFSDCSLFPIDAPAVLPTAFSLIPSLIQSQVWKERHAGLAALGTLAESCTDDITPQLGGIVQLVPIKFYYYTKY